MGISVVDADSVRRLLSMSLCIDLMQETQIAISQGEIKIPLRTTLPLHEGKASFLVMPGEVGAPGIFGAKLLSIYPDNPAQGLAAIQGYVLLFDAADGSPKALVDAASLTALRTAAASAAATRALAKLDASRLGLLGYGVQAESHLEAMCAVRHIGEVRVWGPNIEKATAFAARHQRPELIIEAVETAGEAVRDADVVCAVSNARDPVIVADDVSPGAHLNLVGAHKPNGREADAETLSRSRVYTEVTEFALAEAGDLILAIEEGVFCASAILGEIGEVFAGTLPGRTSDDEITLYKSLGNTAQDLAAAGFVAERNRLLGQSV